MTDEELAAIRERAEKMAPESWSQMLRSRKDTLDLVAEVERLQGEEDHLQDALGETQRLMGESNDALIHKLRDAEAEVTRLQRIINRVRSAVASVVNGPRLTIDGYDVRLGVLAAILDGEEQS